MSETVKGPVVPEPEIGKVAQATFVLLPEPARLYGRRAARLRRLAVDSPMGEYLAYIAVLADAQQQAAQAGAAVPLPADEDHLAWCLEHGQPLFGRSDWPRDASWRAILDTVLTVMPRASAPASAQAAMEALAASGVEQREALADRCLRLTPLEADLAPAVFVIAALQVRWAGLAAGLPAQRLAPIQPGWLCPVCGSRPVASLMDSQGAAPRLRYLACSLCDSRWHYTRAVCADCGESKSIAYHEIEGVAGPARAETCDECESYVKLLQCDKDPDVDALADDLASAGLDIMVQEAGWQRNAPNPFLLTG